jgi:hypothetical protein
MSRGCRSGDYLEASLEPGFGYLRFVKNLKGASFDVVALLDNSTFERLALDSLAALSVRAYVMTSVQVLLEDPHFTMVGNSSIQEEEEKLGYRRRFPGGWEIRAGDGKMLATTRSLDDRQAELPIDIAIAPERVIERLRDRWCGSDDTDPDFRSFLRTIFSNKSSNKRKGFSEVALFIEGPQDRSEDIRRALAENGCDFQEVSSGARPELVEFSVRKPLVSPPTSFEVISEFEALISGIIRPYGATVTGNEVS